MRKDSLDLYDGPSGLYRQKYDYRRDKTAEAKQFFMQQIGNELISSGFQIIDQSTGKKVPDLSIRKDNNLICYIEVEIQDRETGFWPGVFERKGDYCNREDTYILTFTETGKQNRLTYALDIDWVKHHKHGNKKELFYHSNKDMYNQLNNFKEWILRTHD